MLSSHTVYAYLLLLAFCCCFGLPADAQKTDPSEVYGLRSVERRLTDPMKNLRNWNKGDPCTSNWTGVSCFHEIGTDGYLHVRQLRLMNMNLSGHLAPELRKLSHLEILNFMWNNLTGSIPKEIGEISSMKLLLLNGNQLSGSLPTELGHLSSLNRFQIDENSISGTIPKSFSNLTNVKHLHFNNNSLSGEIPLELANLTNILHLLLDSNNLSGILPPQLSALPNLRILQLDNNNFRGSIIPPTYGNFSRLVKLSLRNCSLEGGLPDFSGIPNLSYLDLSWNELTGSIPPKLLSKAMTTIDLSDNRLNGSIPESFSDLPLLQKLSLKNNNLSGSVHHSLWQKISFHTNARLKLDLRNNSLSSLQGDLNPPASVTLRLDGNPICENGNILNIALFCGSDGKDWISTKSTNYSVDCLAQSCPTSDFYEYNLASPLRCFCAAPLRIGYRLKSPSFSYFPPYVDQFEDYVTTSLHLKLYQFWIDSYQWEEGPRLRMYLKFFPRVNDSYSRTFNESEVRRIRAIFTSWRFPGSDFFGPYELLNFTLLGPYSYVEFNTERAGMSRGVLGIITAGAVITAVAFSAVAAALVLKRHSWHQREISRRRRSPSKVSLKIEGIREFSCRELARATDDFSSSTLIGCGGYGKVYRGILSDKTIAAIKRADEESLQGEKEFLNEIELLSRLHHRNLVSLIGYCDEEGEQMLVYEFIPNGTLRHWLSGSKVLSFGTRLSIALGATKGLLYLHTEADPPVFHRDVKASNILIDANFNAKVADFGLSRLAPVLEDENDVPKHVSTVVRGTPGYLDPEYLLTHKLTDKSDVYSLGVVFLELLTGMHAISHGKNIVREVKAAHERGKIMSMVDKKMGTSCSFDSVEKFGALALRCCHDEQEKRPSMWEVVKELEGVVQGVPETGPRVVTTETESLLASSSSSSINYESSSLLGSDLSSGVIHSITTR